MNNATCQLFSGKFVNAPYLETVANYLRKVGTTLYLASVNRIITTLPYIFGLFEIPNQFVPVVHKQTFQFSLI